MVEEQESNYEIKKMIRQLKVHLSVDFFGCLELRTFCQNI